MDNNTIILILGVTVPSVLYVLISTIDRMHRRTVDARIAEADARKAEASAKQEQARTDREIMQNKPKETIESVHDYQPYEGGYTQEMKQ